MRRNINVGVNRSWKFREKYAEGTVPDYRIANRERKRVQGRPCCDKE